MPRFQGSPQALAQQAGDMLDPGLAQPTLDSQQAQGAVHRLDEAARLVGLDGLDLVPRDPINDLSPAPQRTLADSMDRRREGPRPPLPLEYLGRGELLI